MAQIYRFGPKSLKKTPRNHYHHQMLRDLSALFVGAAQNKVLICGAAVCSKLASGYNYYYFYDFVCYLQLLFMLFKKLLDFSIFKKESNLILVSRELQLHLCIYKLSICACCPVRDCQSKIFFTILLYCFVIFQLSLSWNLRCPFSDIAVH